MKPCTLLKSLGLVLGLALALPALPAAAQDGYKLPVEAAGVHASFMVTPPLKGRYFCSMDPDVRANAPGSCPKCGMDLELAPTRVRLVMGSSNVKGRKVTIAVVGHPSFSHGAVLDAAGNAEVFFPLTPGTYTLTASMPVPGTRRYVKVSAPYRAR